MPKPKRTPDWPWETSDSSRVVDAAAIVRDASLQARVRMLPPVAKKYANEMQAGVKFPPVSLADVGGVLYLLDGWHRMEAAAAINGHTGVEATVRAMSKAEAAWEAAAANLKHGQGYTPRDKRNVLSAYIKARKHKAGSDIVKSYRDIGAELGIKLSTLYRWMEADHPHTFKAMGKEGTPRENSGPPEIDPDPETVRRAEQALRELRHYSDSLLSPAARFDLIEETLRMVEQMKLKPNAEADW